MPIYTYECKESHTFDKLRSIADADKRIKCPECGAASKRTIALAFDQNQSKSKGYNRKVRQRFTNW